MKTIDLSLKAFRKRQSPFTGFCHKPQEAIPFYENLCFVFTLFQKKQVEESLEAQALLKRLLAFQNTEKKFPAYLHQYPEAKDPTLLLKIAPIFQRLLDEHSVALSDLLRKELQEVMQHLPLKEPENPLWKHRYSCLKGLPSMYQPTSLEECVEVLISNQCVERETTLPILYHAEMQLVLFQDPFLYREEIEPSALEWPLAEKEGFSPRLLKDHPAQMRSSLLRPFEVKKVHDSPVWVENTLIWKEEGLRSLIIEGAKPINQTSSEKTFLFSLEGPYVPQKRDPLEALCYCARFNLLKITVNGKAANIFALGDLVELKTSQVKIGLIFEKKEGQGDFIGHIHPGNRKKQREEDLAFSAYDWLIGLRTARRDTPCQLVLRVATSSFCNE